MENDEDKREQEEREWRSDRHYKTNNFKLKTAIISIGVTFLLALITYTVILYGGKLIVDEDDLLLSAPTVIETEEGEVIWEIYEEYRKPVKLTDLPEHVTQSFVAIEDKRFYEHAGVDFRAIVRALYKDILARSKVEGASTITQQLAKNVFLTNDKTWLRKTKEVMVALYLEREFTKDEILEMYINAIYFGQGQYGIEAAANKYFSKSAKDLEISEAALLAGIVNAPNGYSPVDKPDKAIKRRNLVLKIMTENEVISEENRQLAAETSLNLKLSQRPENSSYESFVDLVLKEAHDKHDLDLKELQRGGYKLTTKFKPKYQEIAQEEFKKGEYFPGNQKGTEGAFVMLDSKTGGIVSAVGGRDFELTHLNRVNQKRQPGSTMKPLAVYGPALMQEAYDPYTLLPDKEMNWGDYKPQNHDKSYWGNVSIYEAIVQSKNVSAVWLLNEIGIKESKKYLEKMNMNIEDNELHIALGGLTEGLTPLNMAEGYRTFAQRGEYVESFAISKLTNRKKKVVFEAKQTAKQVFDEQTAWEMTEILQTTVQRGTASAGNYPKALAGKTGSTSHPLAPGHNKDAWFVGYTPEYVTSLWMGYDVSDKDHYLIGGSSYPTRLTKTILSRINEIDPLESSFEQPENAVALEEPIQLPKEVKLTSNRVFGGLKLIKGRLSWEAPADKRTVYRVYELIENEEKLVEEVQGESEYIVDSLPIFSNREFFVVPYDPFTGKEGKQSNIVSLSL